MKIAGSDNLRGAAFMVASMAGFAVEDMFLKAAAQIMPLGQVLFIFGAAGTLAFIGLVASNGQAIWHPAYLSRPLLIRGGFEVMGRLFYALAFVLIPLSTASAILQATPLLVVAGAAIVFGEKVGWRRWTAILLGFFGVMVILRPGFEGFDALALLAVLGMIGFAGRDLATRAAPPVLSNLQLGICGFTMLTIVGAGLSLLQGPWVTPGPWGEFYLAGAIAFGVSGYFWLTVAMRTGDIGAVTPFRYTRLLFALVLGVLVFRERPDIWMLIGSAIVVGSGIFALLRSAAQTKAAP